MSSDKKPDLTGGLDEQGYEIKDELKIRKVLEAHTEWNFEFTKNTKYAYDLRIKEWDNKPDGPEDNDVVGFVELERSRSDRTHSWITGDIPDGWKFYSFLKRKVYEWDVETQSWNGLKENYERTVYLKFNHALDNCFAATIQDIYKEGEPTKFSDGSKSNSYIKLDLDSSHVVTGIDESTQFIKEYISSTDSGQTSLLSY